MAAVCALRWVVQLGYADLEIICFVDNTSALGALVRGCSRKSDWNSLIGNLWLLASQKLFLIHHAPRRPSEKAQEIADLTAHGFQCIDWVFPDDAPWG
eukprot:8043965-Pyramimonas_sp.AAC.1